ncbi:MAG: Rieske 2Fe-2S domain-containing protein [Chloroflexi bacterium]|nr:Rieske 2Fe-2S domain-containing protein [Chloroflexota bacterium]
MLSRHDNELLTQVGPDTPVGRLFRRFWIPALLSEELPGPDCEPVRLRLLGEDLLAFKDSNSRVAILDAFCPHRSHRCFFGRNEECGLRCVYHGWKFDVDGNCVDMPNCRLTGGGGGGRVRRTCLTTSLTARTARRVAWNRHSWWLAVGQISFSTSGYSRESSVMTSLGWTPAVRRRSMNVLTIPWSTSFVLGSKV